VEAAVILAAFLAAVGTMKHRPPLKLSAHPNVADLAEERRLRTKSDEAPMLFVGFRTAPPPSHPAAQALLAGIMQGAGEREKDEALLDAGQRLAEAAQKAAPAAPERRQRLGWLRRVLGLVRRSRPS
jgi:hypothetical protein